MICFFDLFYELRFKKINKVTEKKFDPNKNIELFSHLQKFSFCDTKFPLVDGEEVFDDPDDAAFIHFGWFDRTLN